MKGRLFVLMVVGFCAVLLVGCSSGDGVDAPATNGTPKVEAVGTKAGAKSAKSPKKGTKRKIPIAKLIANIKRELDPMGEIWKEDYDTGKLLGRLNGSFQERGYFSRIPSGPAVSGVESNIRALASTHALLVEGFNAEVPEFDAAPKRTILQPGERWEPKEEELFATIRLEIDLQGSVSAAAKMIDDFPNKLERLVVVTGDRARPGGVTLYAECWFERPLPMPKIDLPWPELEDRLLAAGWDPEDEEVLAMPEVQQLKELVITGRQRLVDVRNTLAVASDFPRWFLRNKFLDKKSLAAQSIKGHELLGTVAGE